jgi:hypothetical protein
LLVSANNSYQRTEEDLLTLTGISISGSTQQRLVHRQAFAAWETSEPVETICIDGGKARIRTPKGEPSAWKDYKAVSLAEQGVGAYFQQNQQLVNWVNSQRRVATVSCLGDGHDGIWNLFEQIGEPHQRREILDWFHLMENLYKVGGSLHRLSQVRTGLWQGKVDEAIEAFSDCSREAAGNFVAYLRKHRHRIVNYQSLQMEGVTIGSGSVESLVKQVGRRVKISGAQWDSKHVDQVLKQRCAYLNGQFSTAAIPQTAH